MKNVRTAAVLAALTVLAMTPVGARAELVTLANSTSLQARAEGVWAQTHPMRNGYEQAPARAPSTCNLVFTNGPGTRVATCR